jgi:beta-lactamase superfamily II metal-dependent hydrolase
LRFGSFLECRILKIPHHGQGLGDPAIVRKFIELSGPEVAVITNKSSAELDKDLLEQLRKQGAQVYVTGDSGAVVVEGGGVSVVGDE